MARVVLTEEIWKQLQETMREFGCYQSKNNYNIMEAILWKLRTGATWRDIPQELCPWKTAYNRFNRWAEKGLWDKFFLSYEEKLIRNGYSSMEVTYALINMRLELGLVKLEQLANHEVEQLQKSILPSMQMDIRSILKSLGVKSTTVKLRNN